MKKIALLFMVFLLLLPACTPTAKTTMNARNVFYAGGNNGVKAALLKAGYMLVDDFDKADVFVLNGEVPSPHIINAKLGYGAGLVLIPGDNTLHYGADLDAQALLGQTVASWAISDHPVSLEVDGFFGKDDPLVTEIDWTTAPQIRERAFLSRPGPGKPLIRVNGYIEVVLEKITDKEFYLSAFLDERYNLQFQEWKYFDYLIYHLVERAAGAEPMTFAEYSAQTR